VYLSARNLPNVRVLPYREASAYDVLNANELLIEADALQRQRRWRRCVTFMR
jgi:ribosomal protein L4